jgi:hypothetical protein
MDSVIQIDEAGSEKRLEEAVCETSKRFSMRCWCKVGRIWVAGRYEGRQDELTLRLLNRLNA